MPRHMVWIERPNVGGWGCSDCAWLFKLPGLPKGPSLEEMKQQFADQRDKEFARHICLAHPKSKAAPAR
jgi:hypothetical protein